MNQNYIYRRSFTRVITFTFSELVNSLKIVNTLNLDDNSGDNYATLLNVYKPESINYYIEVSDNKFKIYNTPLLSGFIFNGLLTYENAERYLEARVSLTGKSGHSPLLGYAFDGYPIYGPLGFDKSDDNYNDVTVDINISGRLKILKSSYTSSTLDSNNNPLYIKNLRFGLL